MLGKHSINYILSPYHFETETCYVAQASLDLMIFLPLPSVTIISTLAVLLRVISSSHWVSDQLLCLLLEHRVSISRTSHNYEEYPLAFYYFYLIKAQPGFEIIHGVPAIAKRHSIIPYVTIYLFICGLSCFQSGQLIQTFYNHLELTLMWGK